MNHNKKVWLPLGVAAVIALSVYVGVRMERARIERACDKGMEELNSAISNIFSSRRDYSSDAIDKVDYLLELIEETYVDTLNMATLVEKVLPAVISELDPHSVYIPADDLEETEEQLNGTFSGIGVQFHIENDTVMVISVIAGGPSEKVGLMPGDRIVSINDSAFVGKEITNEKVFKNLRGPKGTTVRVGIRRATADEELKYDIVRGDIPVNSVIASYVIDGGIGYIKVDNFGRNTYNEFFTALVTLQRAGASGFIIDLRGNSGGYMEVCARMVNEFLGRGTLIVYTEGKAQPREELRADGTGNFQQTPVVVLIDEWSASASEIFAGSIQDNDRGTIVGRRSFGKGLVQRQFDLGDGSAVRLTTARYYIPSGRCIQKPYEMGRDEDYQSDLVNRYRHGEFYSQDSIQLSDTVAYTTAMGRAVYGGGGIMPDLFIPRDTLGETAYFNKIVNAALAYSFAFQYADSHRELLSAYSDFTSLEQYLRRQNLVDALARFAADKVKPVPSEIQKSRRNLERLVIAYIMRQVKDENYFYQEFYRDDSTYCAGIRLLREGRAVPKE